MKRILTIIILTASCKSPSAITSEGFDPFSYNITKTIHASNGAVATAHPLASIAGVEIMKKGGNAFDAAITTQLVLAVVYPGAGNIGGGGFAVARRSDGELISLDFRETAPAAAYENMYLDSLGNVIPSKSIRGAGASGVPGTVAGIFELLKYAKLDFPKLIAPALTLARQGFVITESEASSLNRQQSEIEKYSRSKTAFYRTQPWKAGDTLVQPELAGTLQRLIKEGRDGFYKGETARLIVDEMLNNHGYITASDLANYQAKWRAPQSFIYRDHEIVTMALPSSGGVLLQQMLGMVEERHLKSYGHLSRRSVQLMVEVERRAYADRAAYLGDPDFIHVPVAKLTSREYLKSRMKDYVEGYAGNSLITQAGELPRKESEETTHISIIDNQGNAVAVTTTLNDSYGSRTVVSGAGFLLNNEMDDFSIKPGEPNLYGAIGGKANAIDSGKRMLSSMSPTIVLKNKQPYLVVGTPGGTTIPTSVFQSLVNIIDFKLTTSDAVNLPKFHHQWMPDVIYVESGFPDSTTRKLREIGYNIQTRGSIGRTEMIRVKPDGTFEAVADNRGDDSAFGY